MAVPVQAKTRRRLALLFTVPIAFSLMFFIANTTAENTDIQILAVQNFRTTLSTMVSLTQEAEAAERGFLLTGDDKYLTPFQQAQAQIRTQIVLCRTLFKERPELHARVESLIQSIEEKFSQIQKTLDVQRASGFAAAVDFTTSGIMLEKMDDVRRVADDLQVDLGNELKAAYERQRGLNKRVFVFFLVGTAVTIVVLISLYNTLLEYIQGQDLAQAQLATLNQELEHRIEERTRELQQSNEELQQFAYVASHDLQEPLRTVTSFTQLLQARYKNKLDGDADEFISYIVSSSRRMTDLINGLLALGRLRKAGQPTSIYPLEKLLSDAQTSLQAAIRETGTSIQHTALPSLMVDPVQITQLFQNLMSNAIKYRRNEPPAIRVGAKKTPAEWIFSVSDNGQGFEQQYAERIFALFQRLHGRNVEGTGMGLSIARRIVERHGGRIWAESQPGAGSTFYFSLPSTLDVSRRAQQPEPAAAVRS